jgi:hypothetical protein
MKSKVLLTIVMLTVFQFIYSQEEKTKIISDSIPSIDLEKQKLIESTQNETTKSADPLLDKKSDSNIVVPVLATTAVAGTAVLATQKKAEENAKKEADKVLREKVKEKKEAASKKKEIAKNKKVERQNDKLKKEQKELINNQKKISSLEKDLAKIIDKVEDAQKELLRDIEKHNKKLSKGKLSENDIKKFEKDKAKQEKRIEDLKEDVEKAQKKIKKSKK